LNQLAGRVMLAAAIEGEELIDAALIETVLGDLQADLPAPRAAAGNPEPEAEPEPENEPEPEAAPDLPDEGLVARVAELEARLEQQDAALRRVLTLLVDWVDAEPSHAGVTPIRAPAAWDAAA
jgi:hypothetical protein